MSEPIRVAILEDHQATLDGYRYRLASAPDILVTDTPMVGEDLPPALEAQPVDVLLLDVNVPTSAKDATLYPILHMIPSLIDQYPEMVVAVLSMYDNRTLVRNLLDTGISGYILKEDRAAIVDLAAVVRILAAGGTYYSSKIARMLQAPRDEHVKQLTDRQLQVLSYRAAYPDLKTGEIANRMGIAPSTVRNTLSQAYLQLEVSSCAAAIANARQLGLIPGEMMLPPSLADSDQ